MRNLRINGERLWASLMELAKIGATEKGGVCRLAASDLDDVARAVARVAQEVAHVGGAVGRAHAHLVAVAGERADEVVDGPFAETRSQVVDDEQFHRFPFCCLL